MLVFTVDLEFNSDGSNINFSIKVGVGRFLVSLPRLLLSRMDHFIQNRNLRSTQDILDGLNLGIKALDSFFQRINLFHFEVVIGTGDPFLSALGCGSVWTLLGPILTALSSGQRLRASPRVAVHPDYNGQSFKVYLHCIFQFTLGQIIINELRRVTFAWYARTFS